MAGVQGRVAFGLRHFCILCFSKKGLGQQNSHEDPNLTMYWHRQIGNVAEFLTENPRGRGTKILGVYAFFTCNLEQSLSASLLLKSGMEVSRTSLSLETGLET